MGPKLLIFVFTFLVIGMGWLGHHRKFSYIRQVDGGLLWLNLLYLLTLCLVPFATSVLSEHPGRASSVVYAGVMALVLLLSAGLSVYGLRAPYLATPDLRISVRQDMILSPLLSSALFLVSAGLAFGSSARAGALDPGPDRARLRLVRLPRPQDRLMQAFAMWIRMGASRAEEGSMNANQAVLTGGRGARVREWLVEEVRHALPAVVFFAIGFNLIVLSMNLVLAQYFIHFSGFLVATTAALVVGKAVLVADKMPFLRRFDTAPLIRPILFKTFVYWAFVFVARLLEAWIHYAVETGKVFGFRSVHGATILLAPVPVHPALDPGAVPDLHGGVGAERGVRRRRAGAHPVQASLKQAETEPPTAGARAGPSEPAGRDAFGCRAVAAGDRRASRAGGAGLRPWTGGDRGTLENVT